MATRMTTIILDASAPLSPELVTGIREELRDVLVGNRDEFDVPALLGQVYVVAIAAGQPLAWFERIYAWANGIDPPAGILAVIVDGKPSDAENALLGGFDDVVMAAVSSRELTARIRAVSRRVYWRRLARPGRIRFGAITVDLDGHSLWLDGQVIPLTATELAVMRALVRARGRALTRVDLLDGAWGDVELDVSERAVDNVILRLRRKMSRPELIQTVRGVGFRIAIEE